MAVEIAPICKVPNCTKDAQTLSKVGDQVHYMNTCSRHWNDLIPEEIKVLMKEIKT